MSIIAEHFGHRTRAQSEFPELATLMARIKRAYRPLEVVLYGSRARGEATADSDWDIKVIVDDDTEENLFSPVFGWKVQEGSGVYADVSCAKLSEFAADIDVANSAAKEIVGHGILLESH